MSVAGDNTKVERVVEACEDFINAVFTQRAAKISGKVVDAPNGAANARGELADALREFLRPRLRVLQGGKQGYSDDTPEDERPTCKVCAQREPCTKINCRHWAEALRTAIKEPPGVA